MMEYVSPNAAAFWRFLFGFAALILLTIKSLPSKATIKENGVGIFLTGFFGLFGFIFCFTQGLYYTEALNGALILAITPAITLIFAVAFQGHKAKLKEVVGIVLALIGVLYLLTQGDVSKLSGIELGKGELYFMFATVFFSLQNIWIKKYSGRMNGVSFTMLTNFICFITLGFLMVAEPEFSVSQPWRFWIAAFGMGVPGTALAYYCWNMGVKKIGPTKGVIFLNTIPLMVALFAIPFGASLYLYHGISFLLIVSGVLSMQVGKR